jgi:energy-coupling factor transport system permease protein
MAASGQSLNFLDQDSHLHRIYPLIKLSWVFVVAIGLFFYRHPRSGAIMFAAVFLLALTLGRVPLRVILRSSRLIFGLGILLMIFHFFADPGEVVWRFGPLTITDGGLYEGPIFFFRLSVIVLSSFVLIWTTDSRDLMVSLTQTGLSYRYAFAVFLALRFLPLVQREVEAVRAAHTIRGQAARSTILHRIKLWQRYMFTVLINGLRKAEMAATALECRGFGAYPHRVYVKPVTFHPDGLWLVIVFALATALLVAWERLI